MIHRNDLGDYGNDAMNHDDADAVDCKDSGFDMEDADRNDGKALAALDVSSSRC
jgi:hypothetical protein